MKKYLELIYLILILTLSFSCADKKMSETLVNEFPLTTQSKSDTLKFTTGVRTIIQDSKGQYWIGSHSEGVCLYDGQSYKYFTTKDGLPSNQVRSIQEGSNGVIWFGTANGVSSYNGDEIQSYTAKSHFPNFELIPNDSHLWFNAGINHVVYQFDGDRLNYLNLPIPKNQSQGDSYGVTGISKANDGRIWIASYSALFYFDGQEIHVFEDSQLALKGNDKLHIRSVFADSQGRIWIGNNGIGVLLYDGDSTINFSEENGLIDVNSLRSGHPSLAGTLEHVFAIQEDRHGNIWFGDRDTGAWKYDGKSVTNYTIDDKLETQMIWDITTDQNNNLLFAMADGGVYMFNGKAFDKKF